MKKSTATFAAWLPLGATITGMCLLMYIVVQQVERQALNDPQIEIADTLGSEIALNATSSAMAFKPINIEGYATWIVLYDSNFKPIAGSGRLDGELLVVVEDRELQGSTGGGRRVPPALGVNRP